MSTEHVVEDAAPTSAAFAAVFGARTECGHDDAAQKITLLQSQPPTTWCGACVEWLQGLVEQYQRGAISSAEVYAALAGRRWPVEQAEQFINDLEEAA